MRAIAERYGIPVKPGALVRHLSVGEQQRVEILKALSRNARVLILDEPTAVLVPQEVDVLFKALNRLRQEGLSVIFISHKLHEVMTVCDRITVLRDGQQVGTVAKSDTNQTELARMMVGRENFGVTRQGERVPGEVLLRVDGLSARGRKGLTAAQPGLALKCRPARYWGSPGFRATARASSRRCWTGCSNPPPGTSGWQGRM